MSESSDRLLIVSADGHTAITPQDVRPYLDEQYHHWLPSLEEENAEYIQFTRLVSDFKEEALNVFDKDGLVREGRAYSASSNVEHRLEEMDREGIAAEILIKGTQLAIAPFFAVNNHPYPADVRFAGLRAYHRWVAECIERSGGRLFGVAEAGPCLDMDETIKELRWVAAHGFRSVAVPGIVIDPELPPLFDEYYEPFWRECTELGLVLSVHAGHGQEQGSLFEFLKRITAGSTSEETLRILNSDTEGSPFAFTFVPAQVMWSLMIGGVFDRYPSLQLALTEVRADWVPAALRVLDARFEQGDTPLRRRPSEYWRSNCWSGASSIKRSEIRLRHEIGVDRIMFGRDFPHPEGTWPNTWDWIRDAFRDVDEDEARLILGENAVRCYGLDESFLRTIASRIGPRPEEVLGDHKVDEELVKQFHARGGYERSREDIDERAVVELFSRDLMSASRR